MFIIQVVSVITNKTLYFRRKEKGDHLFTSSKDNAKVFQSAFEASEIISEIKNECYSIVKDVTIFSPNNAPDSRQHGKIISKPKQVLTKFDGSGEIYERKGKSDCVLRAIHNVGLYKYDEIYEKLYLSYLSNPKKYGYKGKYDPADGSYFQHYYDVIQDKVEKIYEFSYLDYSISLNTGRKKPLYKTYTLNQVQQEFRKGKYLIGIKGHVMSLIDGVYWDRGALGKRTKVLVILKVK